MVQLDKALMAVESLKVEFLGFEKFGGEGDGRKVNLGFRKSQDSRVQVGVNIID